MSAEGAGVGVGVEGGAVVPFSLAAEVRDRGLRVPVVSGGQRGSLFRPILSVTAGRRGAPEANGGAGGGGGDQWSCWRAPSAPTHSPALYTSA